MLQENLTSYILAGGKSSRFGSDKALAIIDGIPLISRLLEQLRANDFENIFVVADRADRYQEIKLSTIIDLRPQLGPLGGLWTALTHRLEQFGPGWVLLLPCDLVEFQASWISQWEHSLEKHIFSKAPSAAAIAFYEEYWLPLPALYHTSLLPIVKKSIDLDRLSLQSLLNSLTDTAVAVHQQPSSTIRTANTPDELQTHLKSRESTSTKEQ